ncbi:ATP-binding protein [Candidatus Solincola tengchongensis]|uniref:sensor histidine kinase n=1 Tax=Candidatus Solincola tengchongensis TaxID=2900693 RepID=UPI00257B232A|nr:ATP-binding protein [Candidatus Solincola tengchongensis]
MKSLNRILITRYTAIVAAILVVLSLLVIVPIRNYTLSRESRDLKVQAQLFAGHAESYFREGMSVEEIDDRLEDLAGQLPVRLTLIDTEGKVLGDSEYPAEHMENHAGRPEVAAALRGEVSSARRESRTLGEKFIYAAAPVQVDGKIVGAARVSVQEEDVMPVILRVWWIFLAAFGLLLLVIVGASLWTERTVMGALRELREAVASVARGELERGVTAPRIADFSELAESFNVMAGEVRKRVEELDSERKKLEAILKNVSTGILVADGENRVLLLNPAAEAILGVRLEKASGRRLVEVFTGTELEEAVRIAAAGEKVEREMELLYPRRMTLHLKSQPVIGADGKVSATVSTLEDVTLLRRVDRIRQDFVANVSHELRTPVATVRALVESLLGGALERRETAERFLHDLDRETSRLSQLVEDLLALSRLEAGETVLRMEEIDLRELVDERLEGKAKLAAEYGVEMDATSCGEMMVTADRRLLATLLDNLLDNAIKYNRPGGRVFVGCRAEEGALVLEVRDTGVGMPPEELPRIFERFYRIDRARSRETGGTGLGLSIVKHIAELHGGTVSVQSEPGEGSAFSVRLPRPPGGDRGMGSPA